MRVSWAGISHPGVRRETNEDSYSARPDLGLFVVADGMGGHAAGEIASRVAVEAIEKFIADTVTIDPDKTWPVPYDPNLSVDANRLKGAFQIANRGIADRMGTSEDLHGMATTASAILLGRSVAVVGHVGDSRVYLLRGGALRRLTADHSWVEEQVRAGTMSASAARQHPWRNVVTRALSGGEDPQVDLTEVTLEVGDRVLVCSDGLSTVMPDDRIGALLGRHRDLAAVCEALVAATNDGGGPDNVTTLILQVDAS